MLLANSEVERARLLLSGFGSTNGENSIVLKLNTRRESSRSLKIGTRGSHIRLAAAAILSVVSVLVFRNPGFLIIIPAAYLIDSLVSRKKVFEHAAAFEKDYPAFLLSLASSVRTGLDPLAALLTSDVLFDAESPLRKEIEALRARIDSGMDERQALSAFGESVSHPDVELFKSSFVLARTQGSSLSVCLQRLARVTRQRQSFRRKMRSAIAMQKLSAIGIVCCTIVIGIIQTVTNPDAIKAAVASPLGIRALSCGVLLVVGGLVWMLNLTRAKL